MKKSFYENDGLRLNADGVAATSDFEKAIKKMYVEWLDKGFSPSECRELMLAQVFSTTTFETAMRCLYFAR